MEPYRQINFQTLPKLPDGRLRYPRGWFVVGLDKDFPAGEVRSLHYFGRDLIAWRPQAVQPVSVFEAHCPHSGAHLGKGSVRDGVLRCPLLGTGYDAQGECIAPPRGFPASRCEQLQLKRWETRQIIGLVTVWHDPQSAAPDFELPVLSEYGDRDWSDWYFTKMALKVHPREVIENVADRAHFVYVHGFEHVHRFDNEFAGHLATQHMVGKGGTDLFEEPTQSESIATYFGPAFQITWMDNGVFKSRLLNAHTPIDDTHTDLWFGVLLCTKGLPLDNLESALSEYASVVHSGFEQDVSVWQNKLYRLEPILCDGDGPFARCRKWYQQFYLDLSEAPEKVAPKLNPHLTNLQFAQG